MNNTNMPDTSHYDKCRTISQKLKKSHAVRAFLLVVFALLNGYLHTITLSMTKGLDTTPETNYARNAIFTNGFAYAILAFFSLIAVTVLGILLQQERGKLLLIPTLISAVCVITGLFHIVWGGAMTVLLVIGLWESRDAVWLKHQEGYPYFNERFAEQDYRSHTGYESRYDISSVKNKGDMPDIAGDFDTGNIPKEMWELPAEPDIR